MKRFIAAFKENFVIVVLCGLFACVLGGGVYAFCDWAFVRCNGGLVERQSYWDSGIGARNTIETCTDGSHWVWEADPGSSNK